VRRELAKSHRFVQKSAESTSTRPSSSVLTFGPDVPAHRSSCTQALRHAVVGGATARGVAAALRGVGTAPGPGAALAAGAFPALLAGAPRAAPPPGYEAAGAAAFAVRGDLPRGGLDEHWRRVVVDVTAPADAAAPAALADLAAWVNEHQPIALAVNCAPGDLGPALALFEATALVVYTVGVPGAPALTRAAKESEIPNFKGSYLGRFPLVSADFWTSDHLSERSRSMDAFSGMRARGTLMLKRT